MISALFVGLTLLAPSDPPAAPDAGSTAAESELQTYDLAAFRVRVDHAESLPFVPFTRTRSTDGDYREHEHCLSPERLTDLISELFGDEFEYEDRGLWIDERGRLVVRGPAALQAQVQRTIAFFESVLSAELRLRVDRYLLGPQGSSVSERMRTGVVTAQAAAELRNDLSAPRKSETYTLRVHPGQSARVQRFREHSVVVDYDVEIAQGAAISDPIVGSVSVGTDLAVRAAPAVGGVSLAILAQFADTPDAPRKRKNASASIAGGEDFSRYVDSPQASQSVDLTAFSLGCNSFLPDGAALVFRVDARLGSHTPGEAMTELLVIERVSGELPRLARLEPDGSSGRGLELLNAEMISPPRCEMSGAHSEESRSNFMSYMGRIPEHGWVRGEMRRGDYDSVAEMLSEVGRTGLQFNTDGPWIIGLEDADLTAEMVKAGVTPASLEEDTARLTETPVPLLIEARLLQNGGADPVVRFALPVRAGEDCLAVIGSEWIETWDYDVEVAQFAATPDPTMRIGFDGMFLRVRASIGASGSLILDLSGEARLLARSERFELGSKLIESVEQSDYDTLVISERVLLPAGDAGREPVRIGDPSQLALEVTVTR